MKTLQYNHCNVSCHHSNCVIYRRVAAYSKGSILSPSIEIDQQVWEELKTRAEPLVDTPNTLLRSVLGLPPSDGTDAKDEGKGTTRGGRRRDGGPGDRSPTGGRRGSRAPVGSLLPESEYEFPILRILTERGGSAPARDVVTAVGELVADRLTELDREELANGGQRWQSRVQFTRLRLKERGLIETGSPRGLWELADAGAEALAKHDGTN